MSGHAAPSGPRTDTAYVALGTNVGHRGRALARLREALEQDGVTIVRASSEVLTRPIGVTAQADFHNQVVQLRHEDPWAPLQWLRHCKDAEYAAGRRETYRWGPRRADADILLLGQAGEITVISDELTVPHPQIAARPFLRRLLAEMGAPGAAA